MKYNIITTLRKLDQLIMHLESSSDMGVIGSTSSIDRFVKNEDIYIIETAILSKSPDFIPLLLKLFKMTAQSKLDRKVSEALAVQGEDVVEPLLALLDTEHGPRAAAVLAEIGTPQALDVVTNLSMTFPNFVNPAIKLARKVGNDQAVDFLVSMMVDNKPYGFPQNLIKKDENQVRVAATNVLQNALESVTGENHRNADEWSVWLVKKKNG